MSLVRTDIQTTRADTRADTRALVWEVPDPPSSVCQGESPLIDLKGGGSELKETEEVWGLWAAAIYQSAWKHFKGY